MAVTLSVSEYGVLPDGRAVTQFALASSSGVKVSLLDYGATLASVELPDRDGRVAEVTHGYDDLAGWLGDTNYFGATIGRVGNRIAAGKFSLEGKDYVLATNNLPAGRPCHLHGGIAGFNRRGWSGRVLERADAKGVEFSYLSPDGEEGYPGELRVTTTYWLNDADELTIEFHATTDRRTIVNLTNHTYWNLTGDPAQPITGHLLQLEADGMLPVRFQ
jgi:aldose 1-epimerase